MSYLANLQDHLVVWYAPYESSATCKRDCNIIFDYLCSERYFGYLCRFKRHKFESALRELLVSISSDPPVDDARTNAQKSSVLGQNEVNRLQPNSVTPSSVPCLEVKFIEVNLMSNRKVGLLHLGSDGSRRLIATCTYNFNQLAFKLAEYLIDPYAS